jgi:hypothetical protein
VQPTLRRTEPPSPTPTVSPTDAAPSATASASTSTLRELAEGTLAAGRYTNSSEEPGLIIELPDGWQSFHHEPRFYDVARVDDDGTRVVGFMRPTRVFGPSDGGPADGPQQVIDLLEQNPGLDVGSPTPVSLAGLDGLAVDISAQTDDTPVVGDEQRVLLGIGPQDAIRLWIFEWDGAPLVVLLVAPPEGMDAWVDEARPVIESIRLAFPGDSQLPVPPGRYSSRPPFDIDFSFVVPDDGWESGHLNGEFFDILRFEGSEPTFPTRWIAFAHPTTIMGATDVAAAGLSPQAAAESIASIDGLETGPVSDFTLDGRSGVKLDLSAASPDTHVFGGPAGNFGLSVDHDARLGIVADGDDLLLALVLSPPAELDAAWAEAEPILASVDF